MKKTKTKTYRYGKYTSILIMSASVTFSIVMQWMMDSFKKAKKDKKYLKKIVLEFD